LLKVEWDTFPSKNMATMSETLDYFLRGESDAFDQAQIKLFNAPVIVFLTIPKKSPAWSIFDLGAFSQTLMLAANNRGLSTMPAHALDRKSTRLNSSHVSISYAVFCLKKKNS